MAGLAASPRIIPVPSTVAELLGIMAIRGVVIPVYSLAEILGYGKDHDPMRWVSLFGTHQPLGFTFESLEGYVRIPSADLWISEEMKVARKHVCQVARIGTLTRPVVSLASAAQTIKGQAGLVGLQKEQ
jgi:chemotaxis signal transduction protein